VDAFHLEPVGVGELLLEFRRAGGAVLQPLPGLLGFLQRLPERREFGRGAIERALGVPAAGFRGVEPAAQRAGLLGRLLVLRAFLVQVLLERLDLAVGAIQPFAEPRQLGRRRFRLRALLGEAGFEVLDQTELRASHRIFVARPAR